jgi:hypothetical protein
MESQVTIKLFTSPGLTAFIRCLRRVLRPNPYGQIVPLEARALKINIAGLHDFRRGVCASTSAKLSHLQDMRAVRVTRNVSCCSIFDLPSTTCRLDWTARRTALHSRR